MHMASTILSKRKFPKSFTISLKYRLGYISNFLTFRTLILKREHRASSFLNCCCCHCCGKRLQNLSIVLCLRIGNSLLLLDSPFETRCSIVGFRLDITAQLSVSFSLAHVRSCQFISAHVGSGSSV